MKYLPVVPAVIPRSREEVLSFAETLSFLLNTILIWLTVILLLRYLGPTIRRVTLCRLSHSWIDIR